MRKVFILSLMLLFYVGSHGLAQVQGYKTNMQTRVQYVVMPDNDVHEDYRKLCAAEQFINRTEAEQFIRRLYNDCANDLKSVVDNYCSSPEIRTWWKKEVSKGMNYNKFRQKFKVVERRVSNTSVAGLTPYESVLSTSGATPSQNSGQGRNYNSVQSGNNRNNDVKRGGYNANQTHNNATKRQYTEDTERLVTFDLLNQKRGEKDLKLFMSSMTLSNFNKLDLDLQEKAIAKMYEKGVNLKQEEVEKLNKYMEVKEKELKKGIQADKQVIDEQSRQDRRTAEKTGKTGSVEMDRLFEANEQSKQSASFAYIQDDEARRNVMRKLMEECSDKNGNIDAQAVKEIIDILNKNPEVIGYRTGDAGNPIFGKNTANMQKTPERQKTPEEKKKDDKNTIKALKVLDEIRKACSGGLCIKKN